MKPTSDDFVPIKGGFKADIITDNKSAGSKKSESTNSFALLNFDDVEDEDIPKNETEDQDTATDDNEKSLDLLFPPIGTSAVGSKKKFLQKLHDNIARTPTTEKEKSPNLDDSTKKKKKKQEPIPEIF